MESLLILWIGWVKVDYIAILPPFVYARGRNFIRFSFFLFKDLYNFKKVDVVSETSICARRTIYLCFFVFLSFSFF